MKVYSFEKLECWQQARELAVWIYNTTTEFSGGRKIWLVFANEKS